MNPVFLEKNFIKSGTN